MFKLLWGLSFVFGANESLPLKDKALVRLPGKVIYQSQLDNKSQFLNEVKCFSEDSVVIQGLKDSPDFPTDLQKVIVLEKLLFQVQKEGTSLEGVKKAFAKLFPKCAGVVLTPFVKKVLYLEVYLLGQYQKGLGQKKSSTDQTALSWVRQQFRSINKKLNHEFLEDFSNPTP